MILTVTPDPDRFAVSVSVTGATPGAAITVEAFPLGRESYTVRFIGAAVGPDAQADDEMAPFGIPITYRATQSGDPGVVSQTAAPLDVSGTVLTSTVRPGTALPVRVSEDRPQEWETRSAWFDVIDRPDPLVTVTPARYRGGEWLLATVGAAERASIVRLLATGEPVMLRASCPEQVDDVICLPLSWFSEPVMPDAPQGTRTMRVTYQAVTRPIAPFSGSQEWTYAVLAARPGTTYATVAAEFATYSALFAGPPAPVAAVVFGS
jgi:hypothetical protein